MDLLIVALILSFPIFYIYGIAKFISSLNQSKKKSEPSTYSLSTRTQYVSIAVQELQAIQSTNPAATLGDVIKSYQVELNQQTPAPAPPAASLAPANTTPASKAPQEQPPAKPQNILNQPINELWQSWYSQNSINLVLYLGAFLVVTSASTLVGFQWDVLSSTLKTIIFSLATIAFIGCGIIFHRMPKISQAGSTFTAIGALLIPLTGTVWALNSQFAQSHFGIAWMAVTSATLLSYACIYLYFKSNFYLYLSSLAIISLMLSFVAVGNLPFQLYILAGICASLLLLLAFVLQKKMSQNQDQQAQPFQVTAQFTMPAFVLYGLYVAISQDMLFTIEVVISLAISILFYAACYLLFNKPWQLLLSLLLGILTGIVCANTFFDSYTSMLAILDLIGLMYISFAKYLFLRRKKEEYLCTLLIGVCLFFFSYLGSILFDSSNIVQFILIFNAALAPILAYYIVGSPRVLYASLLALIFTVHHGLQLYWPLSAPSEILSIGYILCLLACYSIVHIIKLRNQSLAEVMLHGSVGFYLLANACAFASGEKWLLLGINILAALILLLAYSKFKAREILLTSIGLSYILTASLLYALEAPTELYPFVISLTAVGVYGISHLTNPTYPLQRRLALLVFLILSIFIYFRFVIFTLDQTPMLFAAYVITALIGTEAYISKREDVAYAATFSGLITYLWQLNILGIESSQVYTASIGIYFIALAWSRKLRKDPMRQRVLDGIGLAFLLIPTTFQNLLSDGYLYFLLLLSYGIIITIVGISGKYKIYTNSGVLAIVLAVIIQSYGYIMMIPKWLLIGVLGIAFLGVGMYLLAKRQEHKSDSPPQSPQ